MNKRIFFASIVFCWLTTVPGIAQQGSPPPPGSPEQLFAPPVIVINFLGFSEAQATQFRQLLEARGQAAQNLAQQLGTTQKQLEQIASSANPDPTAVGNLFLQLRTLAQQQQQILRRYHENFLQILTEEQKQRIQGVAQAAQLLPAVNAFVALQLIAPPQLPPLQ